ncbi:hypothetical protein COS66_02075 [Candidatus Berkelbacteria bacterium CG06_land_8_20_14_3_00_43_10]|uniref:Transcriptional repressor PaaX-like central Cas2-like domain-containing protein n=1 Tax=Candidatus Berkelbacteria bacterium CG10_big_fil_rev_8_21_14_0_10_43_14 TaxID=1974515 RepID=A0A2M6R939_9BACT|nr:MAG: hypothetical protein AUK41_01475 [Candidatus Berkelbacteria bacterium CG2_30_43_20]PIS07134.1 MAG: hypothetical protein COT79_01000 [Candidatus Berkelbacteria bacterium CG10_big_fil_rev_8_21_14_0_10_43_14]PIU87194.1 MAG: hypothetical protein COS66_02075 [Candidatus Berkelbacteria bacterium CG06_land_8_20_14_3_00_43_10]
MSLRRSLKLELLLNQIALGFVGFNVAIAPHSQRSSWNKLYRAMRANSRSTQYRLRSRIRQLEHGGIIELWEHEYRLTAQGKALVKQFKVHDVTLSHGAWDGRWRLVSYDIPVEKSAQRNTFRRTLKAWGFCLVQKSLWVFPWECSDEISALAHSLDIASYVIYMSTDTVPMQERLITIFGVTK